MTDEQWRLAWILSQIAADLEGEAQRDFLHRASGDPEVESEVADLFEELRAD